MKIRCHHSRYHGGGNNEPHHLHPCMAQFPAWLRDPFFWELIEAQHSPDDQAMNMLFEKFN